MVKRRRRRKIKSHGIYGFLHAYGKRLNRTTILEMSGGEIFAIGMLTVQWAYLEHVLLLETARLANRAKFKVLPAEANSLAFSRRLSAWRILVRDTIKTKKLRQRLLRCQARSRLLRIDGTRSHTDFGNGIRTILIGLEPTATGHPWPLTSPI